MSLGTDFGGILGRFFGPISTTFGAHFQPPENPILNGDFASDLLLKNASTIETLKTRVTARFANQKMDCSREMDLENHPKMAQKWDPNSHAFSIRCVLMLSVDRNIVL